MASYARGNSNYLAVVYTGVFKSLYRTHLHRVNFSN